MSKCQAFLICAYAGMNSPLAWGLSESVLMLHHSKSLQCLTSERWATDSKLPLWSLERNGGQRDVKCCNTKRLPGMMTDTFSLKFQICDCFLLVFCFLLYFQDLCLRVLMLSYNAKIRSFLHVYSILFHPQINTTVSSPLSETENSYSSVLSRAIGLHMSVNRPIAPVPPLALVPQEVLQ